MRKRLGLFTGAFFIALCAASVCTAQDVKIITRSSVNGQTVSESTTYVKGARRRIEQKVSGGPGMDERMARMMPSIAQVYQCDRRRLLQVNDRARKYTVSKLDEEGSVIDEAAGASADAGTAGPSAATRRGGIVNYNITVTDTGQRQEMFGFKARYLKLVTDVIPGPGACTPKAHYEQEGWYIDFEADFSCSSRAPAAPAQRPSREGCQDTFRYKTVGTARMGFPLSVTTTLTDEHGRAMKMTQEVVELKQMPLDAALFDVPAGYTQAQNASELYPQPSAAEMAAMMSGGRSSAGDASAGAADADEGGAGLSSSSKRPGTVRIGVVAINDRSGRLGSTASLREQLIGNLGDTGVEAVGLDSGSPEAEAKQKQCDFILYTDIAALKQASSSRKIGGMLGRAAGVGSGGVDKTESRVEYRLVAVGSASPQLQSTATAKEEGDEASVGSALEQEARAVIAAARRK